MNEQELVGKIKELLEQSGKEMVITAKLVTEQGLTLSEKYLITGAIAEGRISCDLSFSDKKG